MMGIRNLVMIASFSDFTRFLEQKTAELRDYADNFGNASSYSAVIIIAVFIIGCFIISYFANR